MDYICYMFRLWRKSADRDGRTCAHADDVYDIWRMVDVHAAYALRKHTCRRVRDDSGTLTEKWRSDIHKEVM